LLRRTLNLGILAHVDAGKTTLTERLLYAAGVIDAIGSVDAGTTQTDSLALEQQRGITIKSAVASFPIDDVTVNLIDTPGHPDFIAEVERVLNVLDGVVLVISAVEGVQAQTRVLMRALQRLQIPTLMFVNKTDRRGADADRVLGEIVEKLTPSAVAVGAPLIDVLAEHDDALLAAYVNDGEVASDRLQLALAAQTRRALVHPVFFGSAVTGEGVDALQAALTTLLPASGDNGDAPVSASVFKVERAAAGEKIAYVRVFSGSVRVRDSVRFDRGEAKVTAINVFDGAASVPSSRVGAGEIGKLWGLKEIRIGDTIGEPRAGGPAHSFAPPTLEAVAVPLQAAEKGALFVALTQLAEQDPLINVRRDDERREMSVSLYGEVQKEVIAATLDGDFGLQVEFRETTPICVERPIGSGAAVELLGDDANPFLATVGMRVDPAPTGSGVEFRLDVDVGSVPLYVYKSVPAFAEAIEATVRDTLRQGAYGWSVTDCVVTLTRSGYAAPSTTSGDFKKLTPLVLADALKAAGTRVCEPVHRFELDGPADALQRTLGVLAQLRADPQVSMVSDTSFALNGEIAAGRMHLLQQQLGAATHGEGVLELAFARHVPVSGAAPRRPRSDFNPFNRQDYLLRLAGRVGPTQ
jgi:ribosomal protection tetracycline resistance protein